MTDTPNATVVSLQKFSAQLQEDVQGKPQDLKWNVQQHADSQRHNRHPLLQKNKKGFKQFACRRAERLPRLSSTAQLSVGGNAPRCTPPFPAGTRLPPRRLSPEPSRSRRTKRSTAQQSGPRRRPSRERRVSMLTPQLSQTQHTTPLTADRRQQPA